jgi:hypothetical protein
VSPAIVEALATLVVLEREVGKAHRGDAFLHGGQARPTADDEEPHVALVAQDSRGIDQRVEFVDAAEVARVTDDEALPQAPFLA